jgi:hypothetical protein
MLRQLTNGFFCVHNESLIPLFFLQLSCLHHVMLIVSWQQGGKKQIMVSKQTKAHAVSE